MERRTSAPSPVVAAECDENGADEVSPMCAVVDFEALKQNPIVDCAAFKELHRTEEFKNLLNFLDTIEIDDDGNSFSYVNSSQSEFGTPPCSIILCWSLLANRSVGTLLPSFLRRQRKNGSSVLLFSRACVFIIHTILKHGL